MLLFFIEALICFAFTLYLYFRYAMKGLRPYVTVLNIGVWFLTFLTAVIIPFDLQLNSRIIKGENTKESEWELLFFKIMYFVIYWTIYILSWVIIPVAQEYERAGDFTPKERFKRAVKTNLYIYLIFLVLGIAFVLYLIVRQQLTGIRLISFLILLSNIWGIFLVIMMLGYGLVAVPRHVMRLSDYKTRIFYLEFMAGECKENLEERNIDLINCAQKIKSVRSILDTENSNPNRGFIEKIWLDDSIVEEELKNYSRKFSYEDLITLNTNIKRNKYDIIRLKTELDEIFKEWYQLQSLHGLINGGFNYERNWWTRFVKYYYLNIRPWLLRLVAFLLIVLSLATLLSEITLFTNLPLSIFGLLIEQSDNIYMLNILCLIPLCFMFLCSLYGLFKLKLAGYYSVHRNRQTDSTSLLFLASFMCRIGFPLCLNFVQILKLRNVNTMIEEIMGETPAAGKSFMLFFPAILIVLCLFNVFDIYGRFMNLLGFNTFGFTNPQTDDKIDEGNEVLNKMRLTHERHERECRPGEDFKKSEIDKTNITGDSKLLIRK